MNLLLTSIILSLSIINAHAATYVITNPQLIDIPDNSLAVPYPAPITITTAHPDERITKVTFTLHNLSHGFPGDIAIALQSPTTFASLIMAVAGGGDPVSNLTITFDDTAENFLPKPLASGTFKPTSFILFPNPMNPGNMTFMMDSFALTAFIGQDPNGIWNLLVQDIAPGDGGVIADGWTLTIETAINPSPIDLAITTKYCS